MEGTVRCDANYVPLSPISFLERSAVVYGDRLSVVYGDHVKFTWKQTRDRCVRLASSLVSTFQIERNDVVAVLAPNIPETYELHFAVPMAGALLCNLNFHLDPTTLSTMLAQIGSKIIFVDYQFLDVAKGALEMISKSMPTVPQLVLIPDSGKLATPTKSETMDYDALLAMGTPDFEIRRPKDEFDPITLSFTSGTTASPKCVVYSHRGAYLNSFSALLLNEMPSMPVYLWTVPMFHCNGWCLTWAVAAQGGTNIFLRTVNAKDVFESISRHKVTHMGGAPTVLNMISNAPASEKLPLPGKVSVITGGAPPPSQVLFSMEQLGFEVYHAYGSTETYGPSTICTWKPEWNLLQPDRRAEIKSRQGVHHLGMEEVDIKDPVTMKSVPWDAKTIGEIMVRGNTVMNGYFKDTDATKEAFKGGWFRIGDFGVRHSDGYIEFKDRSVDIIISGGDKISTVDVETIIFQHPAVLEAAVVGRPDDQLGETPCAFVKLKEGCNLNSDELMAFCRENLPHYMAPQTVVFGELPKTPTGKTQKFVLREKAKAMVLSNGALN